MRRVLVLPRTLLNLVSLDVGWSYICALVHLFQNPGKRKRVEIELAGYSWWDRLQRSLTAATGKSEPATSNQKGFFGGKGI